MSVNPLSLFPNVTPDAVIARTPGAEPNCGIIVTNEGSFKVFDATDEIADPEVRYSMRRKVLALAVALSNEQLMAILYDVLDNTDVLALLQPPADV
jgi:hypothetical protein